MMKVAICGVRHGHMAGIAKEIAARPELKIVAVAEEQPEACAKYLQAANLKPTHPNLEAMLEEVDFDVLAVGDVYAKRGAQVIRGLEAGKHILSDKPLCTRLEEMRRIRELAMANKRSVIVALSLRYTPELQTARKLLREGAIGRVSNVTVHGLHPLNFRSGRPDWYFQEGMHGGTITDLMIHGIDALGWMTGFPVAEVVAARAWHVEPQEAPFFQDAAQALFRLANDAGALMDCSYKVPAGAHAPWTFQFWGTGGSLFAATNGQIRLQRHREPEMKIEAAFTHKTDYVVDLLNEISPRSGYEQVLTTAESLDSMEKTILAQQAADTGRAHVLV